MFGIGSESLSRAISAMADLWRVVIRQAHYALAQITYNGQGVTVFDVDDATFERPLDLPDALALGPLTRRDAVSRAADKRTEKKCYAQAG